MPEIINENIFKDETEPLEKKPGADFEFSKTTETEQLASDIDTLNDAVNHDGVVKNDDLEKITKSLGEMKVDVGGELCSIEELKSIPNVDVNVKIWKEILDGNFENHKKLSFITPVIAEHLSKLQYLDLDNLTAISDTTAEHISKQQGVLYLNGLTTISDNSAKHLSKHQRHLCLYGLTSISDVSAKYLSKHKNLEVNHRIREIIDKYK